MWPLPSCKLQIQIREVTSGERWRRAAGAARGGGEGVRRGSQRAAGRQRECVAGWKQGSVAGDPCSAPHVPSYTRHDRQRLPCNSLQGAFGAHAALRSHQAGMHALQHGGARRVVCCFDAIPAICTGSFHAPVALCTRHGRAGRRSGWVRCSSRPTCLAGRSAATQVPVMQPHGSGGLSPKPAVARYRRQRSGSRRRRPRSCLCLHAPSHACKFLHRADELTVKGLRLVDGPSPRQGRVEIQVRQLALCCKPAGLPLSACAGWWD